MCVLLLLKNLLAGVGPYHTATVEPEITTPQDLCHINASFQGLYRFADGLLSEDVETEVARNLSRI